MVQALVAHDRKEEEEEDDEWSKLAAVVYADQATCTDEPMCQVPAHLFS